MSRMILFLDMRGVFYAGVGEIFAKVRGDFRRGGGNKIRHGKNANGKENPRKSRKIFPTA